MLQSSSVDGLIIAKKLEGGWRIHISLYLLAWVSQVGIDI